MPEGWNQSFSGSDRPRTRWLLAAGLILVALALRAALGPLLKDQMPYLFFALATMLAARYAGLGPGIASLLIGALLGSFFFTDPTASFRFADGRQVVGLTAYAVLCAVAIAICESLRRASRHTEMLALHADANA